VYIFLFDPPSLPPGVGGGGAKIWPNKRLGEKGFKGVKKWLKIFRMRRAPPHYDKFLLGIKK